MLALLILAPALATSTFNVSIEGFAFVPDSVSVHVGDTVRWTNKDAGTAHTSTGVGTGVAQWNSGNLSTNATFQRVFSDVGSFNYRCNIHTSMTAKVNVAGATTIQPAPGAKAEADAPEALRDVRGRSVTPGKIPASASPTSPTFPSP